MIFRFFTSYISMRARILAIVILLVFLILPISFYWFFTTKKISSVTVSVAGTSEFSITLDGTFGLDGLPLADAMLSYEKNCINTCEITPVLPAVYTLNINSSWKTAIEDSIILSAWENIKRQYQMYDDFVFTKTSTIPSTTTLDSIFSEYNSQNAMTLFPIGIDINNKIWAKRDTWNISQIGTFASWQFTPIRNLMRHIGDLELDSSRSILIAKISDTGYIFFPVDSSSEKQVSFDSDISIKGVVSGKNWSFRTQTGSWILSWNRVMEDIRFTDSIDISPSIRLGYIGRYDSQKLSLGNFPTGESLLIRLDRTTWDSSIVRRWVDINMFFYYKNMPSYIDEQGNIFSIEGK